MVATAATPAPPEQGYQLGDPSFVNVIMPLTVTQCEPVFIYYDTSPAFRLQPNITEGGFEVFFFIPDPTVNYLYWTRLVTFFVPNGTGYLDWICNIPASVSFAAKAAYLQYYVVQPGSSSNCLGDVTTTYSSLSYNATAFASYTATGHTYPSSALSSEISGYTQQPTNTFPTGSFSTIYLNPNLATPTTPTSTTSSASSHKAPSSNKSTIAGSVVGVVVFLLLSLALICFLLRRRRKSSSMATEPLTVESVPGVTSGLVTSQLESYSSTPIVPLPDHQKHLSSTMDTNNAPLHGHWTEPIPDSGVTHTTTPLRDAASVLPSPPPFPPPVPPKAKPVVPPASGLPEPPASGGQTSRLHATSALNITPHAQSSASQRPIAESVVTPPDAPGDVTAPSPRLSTREAQNDSPDLATVLDVISRARFTPGELQIVVDQLIPAPPNLRRHPTMSPPPPYAD